jgi:hypothetical protein
MTVPDDPPEGGDMISMAAATPGRVNVPATSVRRGAIAKWAWAIVALLCAAIAGRLWLHLSFGTLLIVTASLFVAVMLRELWFGERAHRSAQRVRDAHFIREHEVGRERLRELGD